MNSRSCLFLILSTLSSQLCFGQDRPGQDTRSGPPVHSTPPVTQNTEANPKSWKEFTSQDGFFTVLLPGTPVKQLQQAGSPTGPVDYFAYTLQTEAHSYYVAFIDFPEVPNDARGIRKILDGARDGAIATINGTLVSEQDLSLKGMPGRAMTVEGPSQVLKARIYLAELRLYLLMIVASKTPAPTPEAGILDNATVEKFLGSFKLMSRKKLK